MFDLNSTLSKYSPSILTALNVVGIVTTTAFAIDATVKAVNVLNELKEEEKDGIEVPTVEKVRAVAPLYVPTLIMGSMTATCAICSNSINARRTAALAAAYSISETAAEVYRRKVKEVIGEKKEAEVRKEVAKEAIDNAPPRDREIIISGKDVLCYETVTCRYFKCDYEKLRKIENDLNYKLRNEMYISFNELLYEFGLRPTSVGDDIGFNLDDGPVEFDISTQLSEDNEPCIVVGYRIAPRYDFRSLW